MKVRGDEMYNHLCPRHLWRPYSSHSNRAWHFLGEVGIAFLGEVEGAEDWVWFAMNVFYNVYPVWSDDDGGWHEGISYGHSYITKRDTMIATLPIGYGDGYPRNLSNIASVLIGGRRFKVSGRVCMDQIMVDVGDAKVKIGDEVVLIGSQGKSSITAEELAELAETIPYEIVCGLGSRVPRIYT